MAGSLRQLGTWCLIGVFAVGSGWLGVRFADKASSTTPRVAPSWAGKEFDESGLRVTRGIWFRDQQSLREFLFQEGLQQSDAGDDGDIEPLPARFLVKVLREDGAMIEVEFIRPRELSGERGWIRVSDLADPAEPRQSG